MTCDDQWTHAAPVDHVQTNAYCAHCGYNLFTQAVRREPNTGIHVCRCPECGTFAPVGAGIIAVRRGIRIFDSTLLIVRTIALTCLLAMAAVGLTAVQYRMTEEMVSSYRRAAWRYVSASVWRQDILLAYVSSIGTAMALGAGIGAFVVVFIYHWPRRRYRWMLIAPLAGAVAAGAVWHVNKSSATQLFQSPVLFATVDQVVNNHPATPDILRRIELPLSATNTPAQRAKAQAQLQSLRRETEQRLASLAASPSPAVHILAMALAQVLGLWLGILGGRPVVRGILRALIPPSVLTPVAPLWIVDGKPPPRPRLGV